MDYIWEMSMELENDLRESISRRIFPLPIIYFWFWKRKPLLIPSTFLEYTSTMYYSFLSTLPIWITKTKFSIPLRAFYITDFFCPMLEHVLYKIYNYVVIKHVARS